MNDGRIIILAGGASSRMKKAMDVSGSLEKSLLKDADSKPKSMIGVGDDHRPFLDYLLFNVWEAGYKEVLIVTGEHNEIMKAYYGEKEKNNEFHGLNISYVVQKIPVGRVKPLGTADALMQALKYVPDWYGKKFTVCNSDNLYSVQVLHTLKTTIYDNAMIDYNRDALKFNQQRIEKFAITVKDEDHFLLDIIEKPEPHQMEEAKNDNGNIGVSMNIFCFQYEQIMPFLEMVPLHPERNEKELPVAVKMMISQSPGSVYAYPVSEHVPDMTDKSDIKTIIMYLQTHFPKPLF